MSTNRQRTLINVFGSKVDNNFRMLQKDFPLLQSLDFSAETDRFGR